MKDMHRDTLCSMFWPALAILAALAGGASAQLSEAVLPNTTQGVVIVADGPQLAEQWQTTQLAKLLADPVMKPFEEDLLRQFEEEWTGARERLGLTLDDIRGVSSGEISLSLLRMQTGEGAVVLLMDVTGHLNEANAFLAKVGTRLQAEGAKQSAMTVGTTNVTVFLMPKEQPTGPDRYAYYCVANDTVVASDKLEAIQTLLPRLADPAAAAATSISTVPAYQTVLTRCRADLPEGHAPQIRWFIEPFGYARTIRDSVPADPNAPEEDTFDVLKSLGFMAVQGVGGYVDVGSNGFEMVYRTFAYAPKPFEKGMKMCEFTDVFKQTTQMDFTPPTWVPRDCAKSSIGYIDPLAVFDNVETVFDQVVGRGISGVWNDTKESIKSAPNGPQVDLRAELFEQLTGQVVCVIDYEKPITPESERMVLAVQVKPGSETAVEKVVGKLVEGEEDVVIMEFEGHRIWKTEIKVEDEAEDDPYSGGLFDEEEEPVEPLLPDTAICVSNGYIYIASELEFLKEILRARPDARAQLGNTIDFQIVQLAINDLAGDSDVFLKSFARNDEALRPVYEMLRQGKMPESDMMLARALNALMPPKEGQELREVRVDGSKLPEFDTVRRHFGPSGMFGACEQDGWFFKGFILAK